MKPPVNLLVRCLLFLMLFFSGAASAGRALVVDADQASYPLSAGMQFIEDRDGTLTLEQVRKHRSWQTNTAQVFSRGLTTTAYWFKLDLINGSPTPQQRLLVMAYPLLDHFDVFAVTGESQSTVFQGGDTAPFHARNVDNRQFTVPFTLPAAPHGMTLYVRAQTNGAMQVPLSLWRPQTFFEHDSYLFGIQLFYLGVMLAMAAYNFVLYLFLREKAYLLYVMYVIAFTGFVSSYTGIGYQLLWSDWPALQQVGVPFFGHIAGVSACFFALVFLNVRQHSLPLYRLLCATALLDAAMLVACWVLPYGRVLPHALWAGALTAALLIIVGAMVWRRGSLHARYFTLAWISMLIGVLLLHFNKLGWIPHMALTEHAAQIGASIEVFLLSLALADRYNQQRKTQDRLRLSLLEQEQQARTANEKALVIQQQANEELELRVAQRTEELSLTLTQLSELNEKLKDLNTIDGLTQLRNRAYFDEALDREFRRARRDGLTLSVLLIDIDHFKAINDTFGHLAGDACLKHVAACFMAIVKRPADVVARYGGEEFSIILPGNDENGAAMVAEAVRRQIESRPALFNGQEIALTVSIGLAQQRENSTPQQLVEWADHAMYLAKHAGRNRVQRASASIQT